MGAPQSKQFVDVIKGGSVEEVQKELEKGDIDVNAKENSGGKTLLHIAIENGAGGNNKDADTQRRLVALLIKFKSDPNAVTKKGWTPLHYAAWSGMVEVAKMLIEANALVDQGDNNGDTPLHAISHCYHESNRGEFVKVLLDFNANPDGRNKNQDTPLHHACQSGRHEVIQILINSGADVEALNKNGKTPLWVTKKEETKALVKRLIIEQGKSK